MFSECDPKLTIPPPPTLAPAACLRAEFDISCRDVEALYNRLCGTGGDGDLSEENRRRVVWFALVAYKKAHILRTTIDNLDKFRVFRAMFLRDAHNSIDETRSGVAVLEAEKRLFDKISRVAREVLPSPSEQIGQDMLSWFESALRDIEDKYSDLFYENLVASASPIPPQERARYLGMAATSPLYCVTPEASKVLATLLYLRDENTRRVEEANEARRRAELESEFMDTPPQRTLDEIEQDMRRETVANFWLHDTKYGHIWATLMIPHIVHIREIQCSYMSPGTPLTLNERPPRWCRIFADVDVNKDPGKDAFTTYDARVFAHVFRLAVAFMVMTRIPTVRAHHPQYLRNDAEGQLFPVIDAGVGVSVRSSIKKGDTRSPLEHVDDAGLPVDPFVIFVYASRLPEAIQKENFYTYHFVFPAVYCDIKALGRDLECVFKDPGFIGHIKKLPRIEDMALRFLGLCDAQAWSSSHTMRMALSTKLDGDGNLLPSRRLVQLSTVALHHDMPIYNSGIRNPTLQWNGHVLGAPFPAPQPLFLLSKDYISRASCEISPYELRPGSGPGSVGEQLWDAIFASLTSAQPTTTHGHASQGRTHEQHPEQHSQPSSTHSSALSQLNPQDKSDAPALSPASTGALSSNPFAVVSAMSVRASPCLLEAPCEASCLASQRTLAEWREHFCGATLAREETFDQSVLRGIIAASVSHLSKSREVLEMDPEVSKFVLHVYIADAIAGYVNRFIAYVQSGGTAPFFLRKQCTWGADLPYTEYVRFSAKQLQEMFGEKYPVIWPPNSCEEPGRGQRHGGRGLPPAMPKPRKPRLIMINPFQLYQTASRLTFTELADAIPARPDQLDLGCSPYVTREMALKGDIGYCTETDCADAEYYNDLVTFMELGIQTGFVASKPWLRYILGLEDTDNPRTVYDDRVVSGDFVGYINEERKITHIVREFGVRQFLRHIYVLLCSGDHAAAQHVIKYYAYILQNPGVQTRIVPIFQGKEGTGKNLVNDTIASIFGPVAAEPNADISVLCGWNSSLVGKLFVVFNEVNTLSPAEQGRLRSAVTESSITRRQKYIDDRAMANSMNIVILTNQETGLINKTGSDARRWLYLLTSPVPDYDSTLYFRAFASFLGRDGRSWLKTGVTPGILAVAHFLYRLDISDFVPSMLPKETLGRSRALLTQMDSLQDWFYSLLREKKPPLPPSASADTKAIISKLEGEFENWNTGHVFVETSELYHAFIAYTGSRIQQHVFISWLVKTANCCTESRPRAIVGTRRPMILTFYSQAQCAENFNALIGNVLPMDFVDGARKDILDHLSISAPDPLADVLTRAKAMPASLAPAPRADEVFCFVPLSRSEAPQTHLTQTQHSECRDPPSTPRPPPLLSDDEADSQELAERAQGLVAMFRPDRRRGGIQTSAEEESGGDGPATLEQLMRAASRVDAEVRACEERQRISRLQSAPVPADKEVGSSDEEDEESEKEGAGNRFVDDACSEEDEEEGGDGRPASKKQKK